MQITPIKTRIFREHEDLLSFIFKYVKSLKENSILVVTSKIVALAEGRTVEFRSEKQKIALIKKESSFAIKTKYTWLTIKDGMVMANAGIDESNAGSQLGKLILLPKNSFLSAQKIRSQLCRHFKIKNLGIIVSDSGLLPLRSGVIGMAHGYTGFKGVKSYIGQKDIFGRVLKMSKVNVADSLATSATLCMGEGSEQQPLALITEAPVVFTEKVNKRELKISPKEDMYAPLFNQLN